MVKIKDIAKDLFNMKEKNRKLLQDIGTKMREIDKDVFANYVIKQSLKYDYVCVDDARYTNEIKKLKENGFILIKLQISKELQTKRIIHTYPETYKKHIERLEHSSETEIDSIDNSMYDKIINIDKDDLVKEIDNYLFYI